MDIQNAAAVLSRNDAFLMLTQVTVNNPTLYRPFSHFVTDTKWENCNPVLLKKTTLFPKNHIFDTRQSAIFAARFAHFEWGYCTADLPRKWCILLPGTLPSQTRTMQAARVTPRSATMPSWNYMVLSALGIPVRWRRRRHGCWHRGPPSSFFGQLHNPQKEFSAIVVPSFSYLLVLFFCLPARISRSCCEKVIGSKGSSLVRLFEPGPFYIAISG